MPSCLEVLVRYRTSCRLILELTQGKTFSDFESDVMLRSAVERQFEVTGEALNQLLKIDAETAGKISDYRHIIAFRIILIHGYAEIDDRLVWGVVDSKVSILIDEVESLQRRGDRQWRRTSVPINEWELTLFDSSHRALQRLPDIFWLLISIPARATVPGLAREPNLLILLADE